MDGGQLSNEQEWALATLINLDPEDHLDDQVYGTKVKQKIGASWNLNAKAFAEKFRRRGYTVGDADVSGKVRLEGIEQIDGVSYLKYDVQLKVAKCTPPPSENMPAGTRRRDTSIESSNTIFHPVQHGLDAFRLRFTSVINETLEAQDARGFSAEAKIERAGEVAIMPLRD